MFEDDHVELHPIIGGYDPERRNYMQIDSIGVAATPNDRIPFNAAPVDIYAMLGYVPEFLETMEVEWIGSLIPSGNRLGGTLFNPLLTGLLHAPPDLNVFPANAGIMDPPYDPRQPLFVPRPQVPTLHAVVEDNVFMTININLPAPLYHVQLPAPEGLNGLPLFRCRSNLLDLRMTVRSCLTNYLAMMERKSRRKRKLVYRTNPGLMATLKKKAKAKWKSLFKQHDLDYLDFWLASIWIFWGLVKNRKKFKIRKQKKIYFGSHLELWFNI